MSRDGCLLILSRPGKWRDTGGQRGNNLVPPRKMAEFGGQPDDNPVPPREMAEFVGGTIKGGRFFRAGALQNDAKGPSE